MTSTEIGFLNVSFLIGATSSAFLWGILADLNGRRKILIYTLFLNFFNTNIMAFMNTFYGLATCRLLNGFLIGAPGTVTFTYLAEFHSSKLRMKIICYSGIFFTLSWLILPMVSYLILPLNVDYHITNNLKFTSWRLFLIILSLPELITSILLMRLPESPKFLKCKGKYEKALIILKEIYEINNSNKNNNNAGKKWKEYPVKCLKNDVLYRTSDGLSGDVQNTCKTIRIVQGILKQIKTLFRPPLLKLTTLISVITFTNMFG